jgi:hypothetical protein
LVLSQHLQTFLMVCDQQVLDRTLPDTCTAFTNSV